MRKPKLRDWFFLLVPVVLLAGFAFWRQQKEKPHEPFRLVVKQIRSEKLTPLEVYKGFDTKISVIFGYKGEMPDWWKPSDNMEEIYISWSINPRNLPRLIANGKILPFGESENRGIHFLRDENAWAVTYICKAKQVFPSKVTFQGEYWLYDGRDKYDRTDRRLSENSIVVSNFVVRQQGEKIVLPVVPKECPFRVVSATYGKLRGVRPPELHVKLTLQYIGKDKKRPLVLHQLQELDYLKLLQKQFARQNITTKITSEGALTNSRMMVIVAGSGFLIDEKGQMYAGWPSELPRDESSEILYPIYAFQRSQIPPEGKLTFRALISVNNYWPCEINETVRR